MSGKIRRFCKAPLRQTFADLSKSWEAAPMEQLAHAGELIA